MTITSTAINGQTVNQPPVRHTPSVAPTPADALLSRKLRLMEQASCAALFAEWDQLEVKIGALIIDEAGAGQDVTTAKAEVEDAKMMASIGIEGKNEAERAATRAQVLRADPAYLNAVQVLRLAESELAQTSADLETAKRRVRRLDRQIEQRIAILGVLKG